MAALGSQSWLLRLQVRGCYFQARVGPVYLTEKTPSHQWARLDPGPAHLWGLISHPAPCPHPRRLVTLSQAHLFQGKTLTFAVLCVENVFPNSSLGQILLHHSGLTSNVTSPERLLWSPWPRRAKEASYPINHFYFSMTIMEAEISLFIYWSPIFPMRICGDE